MLAFAILIGIFALMVIASICPGILLYPLFIFSVLLLCGMVILGILLVIHAVLIKNGPLLLIGIIIILMGVGMALGLFLGMG